MGIYPQRLFGQVLHLALPLIFRQDSLNTSEDIRYTTKRLGEQLEIVASKAFSTLEEARQIEKILKRKKNPRVAIYLLQR